MDYTTGSIIQYRAFGNELRTVKVNARDEDIKNGRPGFDGFVVKDGKVTDELSWGYDFQVVKVIQK